MASFTSTSWNLPVATLLKSELDIVRTFSIHDFYPTLKSSNAIEGFTKFVRIIIRSTGSTQIGRSKAGQKQSQEKIEHLKIPKKNQLRTYLLDKTRLKWLSILCAALWPELLDSNFQLKKPIRPNKNGEHKIVS